MSDDIEKAKGVLEATKRVLEECKKLGWQSLPITITFSKQTPSESKDAPPTNNQGQIVLELSDGTTNSLKFNLPIQEKKKTAGFWHHVDEANKRLPFIFVVIFFGFLLFLTIFMGCSSAKERQPIVVPAKEPTLKFSLVTFAGEENVSLVTLPWGKDSTREDK